MQTLGFDEYNFNGYKTRHIRAWMFGVLNVQKLANLSR